MSQSASLGLTELKGLLVIPNWLISELIKSYEIQFKIIS
jgi:hypothetical protein